MSHHDPQSPVYCLLTPNLEFVGYTIREKGSVQNVSSEDLQRVHNTVLVVVGNCRKPRKQPSESPRGHRAWSLYMVRNRETTAVLVIVFCVFEKLNGDVGNFKDSNQSSG